MDYYKVMANRRNVLHQGLMVAVIISTAVTAAPEAVAQPLAETLPLSAPSVLNGVFSEQSYILGAGDKVQITVYDHGEYTGQRVILPDGTITLSLIGAVQASGLTARQLEESITTRLKTLLVNPVVTVELSELRPVLVTVAGEVRRPGSVELDDFAEGNPRLSRALIAAGGITQDADIRQVTVRRPTMNGSSQSTVVDLWAAIISDTPVTDVILQEGDSIFVPRLTTDSTIDRRLIARSSYSPETIRVRVVGEVTRPGEVQVPPGSTLSSAVATAGGPTVDARLSQVAYIRLNETGQVETETIDLQNLSDTYQIQEGDVIIVPKRSESSILDFAARLLLPLGALINLFN